MKVVVLGAGVIGVTTAYYLAKQGHDVTVLDRQHGPALETSYANAGEISPGYASPWAAPGIPVKAMKWLFMQHAPLILRMKIDLRMVEWIARMLMNCTPRRYAINKSRMVRLAEYSRDVLIELRRDTGIRYDERTQGTLQLFRTQAQLDGTAKDIEVLKQDGVPYEVLDPAGCIRAEPALAHVRDKIVGGLRLPNDETGDCYKFTAALCEMAKAIGVRFDFARTILGLEAEGDRLTGIDTSAGRITADAYVLALGSFSPKFSRTVGLSLPVYPVKGYSLTYPITDATRAPESTVMDETFKIAITRLGDRVRVGGMAEISGYTNDLPDRRRSTLEHSVSDLFGGSGDVKAASFWSGLRPMTPDGTPIVGRTRYPNLFINTGHGTLGWTMACGSARVIADLMSGRQPDIEVADLGASRYRL
jgi:D-amino-acid dehydrogenase